MPHIQLLRRPCFDKSVARYLSLRGLRSAVESLMCTLPGHAPPTWHRARGSAATPLARPPSAELGCTPASNLITLSRYCTTSLSSHWDSAQRYPFLYLSFLCLSSLTLSFSEMDGALAAAIKQGKALKSEYTRSVGWWSTLFRDE